jgi:hypothetical protein
MPGPLVYVDTSEVHERARDSIRSAIDDLASFIEAKEPELLAYGVYLSDDGARMTVVHVHRDSATLESHLEIGAPAFKPFADLLTLLRIDIYGEPSEKAVERLRAKAKMLGTGDVVVHPPAGGFARFGSL